MIKKKISQAILASSILVAAASQAAAGTLDATSNATANVSASVLQLAHIDGVNDLSFGADTVGSGNQTQSDTYSVCVPAAKFSGSAPRLYSTGEVNDLSYRTYTVGSGDQTSSYTFCVSVYSKTGRL